ncbi:MAG: hypothetical protein MZW92_46680 [Comamonadaceae bacterium]|nr:hypothetical protein [Comamonadaceae bacterium]
MEPSLRSPRPLCPAARRNSRGRGRRRGIARQGATGSGTEAQRTLLRGRTRAPNLARNQSPLKDAVIYRPGVQIKPTAAVVVIADSDDDALQAGKDLAKTSGAEGGARGEGRHRHLARAHSRRGGRRREHDALHLRHPEEHLRAGQAAAGAEVQAAVTVSIPEFRAATLHPLPLPLQRVPALRATPVRMTRSTLSDEGIALDSGPLPELRPVRQRLPHRRAGRRQPGADRSAEARDQAAGLLLRLRTVAA